MGNLPVQTYLIDNPIFELQGIQSVKGDTMLPSAATVILTLSGLLPSSIKIFLKAPVLTSIALT